MLNTHGMNKLDPADIHLTKYLFFTGKGGVGKTSVSSALAVALAEQGKKVALISTDPASNLQDMFGRSLSNALTEVESLPNLFIANFNPIQAADQYKESIVGPMRGILPKQTLQNMEEQLSGSCTVEVAAFNEFTRFLADSEIEASYDYIIFDTAPTGHTLRMLELPAAWNDYLDTTTHDASCLGQLSGLTEQKNIYEHAVVRLKDKQMTTMMIVSRPDQHALYEAERAINELQQLDITSFNIILNGVINEVTGQLSAARKQQQDKTLSSYEQLFSKWPVYIIPMQPFNISCMDTLKHLFDGNYVSGETEEVNAVSNVSLKDMAAQLLDEKKKYIFTMGKGGVGKTTIAFKLAQEMAERGKTVKLATTDPANQWNKYQFEHIEMVYIDQHQALKEYKEEVLTNLPESMTAEQIDYIKEDLRSPCTEEIAFFRAFSELMAEENQDIIIVDTAPTGHTLLLLESTESYNREIERSSQEIPDSVTSLLPKIKNPALTEMIIVTLAEPTPVKEAERLSIDLKRAEIPQRWWVVNQTIAFETTDDTLFNHKIIQERKWLKEIKQRAGNYMAVEPYEGEK